MTNEPPSLVDAWVAEHRPSYPIVSLKNDTFERFLGVRFFPTAAVLSPDGTLAYVGSAGGVNGPLDEALSGAAKGSIYPKVMAKALEDFRAGAYGESYAKLAELLERGRLDDGESDQVRALASHLEASAVAAQAQALVAYQAGRVFEAHGLLEPFLEVEPAVPVAPEMEELARDMRESTDFKKELAAGERMAEAAALEREDEFEQAFELYRSITKKYARTLLAPQASAKAQALIDSGRPGWKRTCDACLRSGKSQRACEKHRAKLRL